MFKAPNRGVWRITHDGSSNFTVRIYPSSGRDRLVTNEIGIYDGTAIVDFGNDIAFWVVRADGNWTIEPQ